MKAKELKKDYISILKKFKIEDQFVETLVDFIETYEGENEAEFHILMVHLMDLLARLKRITLKADAYDKIVETKVKYAEKLDTIKNEYETFQKSGGRSVPMLSEGIDTEKLDLQGDSAS